MMYLKKINVFRLVCDAIRIFMTLRKIGNTIALKKAAEKNEKRKFFSKAKNFWYQNIRHVLTKKMNTHTGCFRSQIRKLQTFEVLKCTAVSQWKSQRQSKKFICILRWNENIRYYIFTSENIKYTLYIINIFLYFTTLYIINILMIRCFGYFNQF